MFAIQANRMNLVQIGDGAKFVGQIADFRNRRDIAIHGIDRLEGDDLGHRGVRLGQMHAQMFHVVMAEDALVGPAVANAVDHRGVVHLVGIDNGVGQNLGQRRQRRLVGNIARSEQQRRFLAMQAGELALKLDMIMVVAGDIAGAARPGAELVNRLVDGLDHLGMLRHAQIIVAAPDLYFAGDAIFIVSGGIGEIAPVAGNLRENPVASLVLQILDRVGKDLFVIHRPPLNALQVLGRYTAPYILWALLYSRYHLTNCYPHQVRSSLIHIKAL